MTRPRTFDWSAAVTLSDLGDLTARYLSGEADESPTYLGPPTHSCGSGVVMTTECPAPSDRASRAG